MARGYFPPILIDCYTYNNIGDWWLERGYSGRTISFSFLFLAFVIEYGFETIIYHDFMRLSARFAKARISFETCKARVSH